MKNLKFLILLFFLCGGLNTEAQITAFDTHHVADEKKGYFFHEENLFLESEKSFSDFITKKEKSIDENSSIENAEFLNAINRINSRLPNAELSLSQFIKKYTPSKLSHDGLFIYSNYLFNKKRFQEAIEYFNTLNLDYLKEEQKHEVHFKKGYSNFIREQFAEAETELSKSKDYKGNYGEEANYYLGILHFKEGEYEKAISSFNDANEDGKYKNITPYYLAQIYFAEGNYAEVINTGTDALENNKSIENKTELNHLVAKSFFQEGKYRDALSYFDYYSKNAKKLRAQDLYQIAYTKFKAGKYSQAVTDFKELQTLNSDIGQNSLYNLGDLYVQLKDKASARNSFYRAAKLGFDGDVQRESQFQYAKLSYELGYDREALIELQNVKSGSPHFTEAQNLMSQLLLKSGDYDKALELMESLTNTTPKIQEAYQQVSYLKGIQLYKDRQYGAAEEFLLRSQTYQLIPKTYALSFYYLGEIGYKLNDFQKSQNNFEQFNVRAKSVNNLPEEANTYTANYNIGYLQLKQKSYALAAEYFTLSINEINQNKPFINSSDIKNRLYPDAILRAADCYFKDNRYDNAIRYYNRSIKNELPGQDYALFQKGRILGIQGKKQEEINTFNTLANKFPNSSYTDDGLYLLARAYYNNGERNSALASAQTLIDNHPNSQLKNQTHLLLGLMYYNENEDQAALEEYVKVIRNNPTQQESNSARTAVTEIYMDNNNPEGLIEFNKNILGYDMTNYAKDSLLYRSAEILYEQGDFVNAKNAYAKHIQQFPESPLSIYSHYNKGECHLVSKEYRNALAEYDYVIQQGQSNLYENALTKAANLSYNKFKNFSKAYTYYNQLTTVTTDADKLFKAHLGSLRSAHRAGRSSAIKTSAQAVIENDKATKPDIALAHFYRAKVFMNENQQDLALEDFRISASENNIMGAESRYWMTFIYYQQRDLGMARTLCETHLKSSRNYEEWMNKGFLLLADISIEQNDLFNARAVLETLIDRYKNEPSQKDLVDLAKQKLAIVSTKESEDSRIIPDDNQ